MPNDRPTLDAAIHECSTMYHVHQVQQQRVLPAVCAAISCNQAAPQPSAKLATVGLHNSASHAHSNVTALQLQQSVLSTACSVCVALPIPPCNATAWLTPPRASPALPTSSAVCCTKPAKPLLLLPLPLPLQLTTISPSVKAL
jgi:hypothetical protein